MNDSETGGRIEKGQKSWLDGIVDEFTDAGLKAQWKEIVDYLRHEHPDPAKVLATVFPDDPKKVKRLTTDLEGIDNIHPTQSNILRKLIKITGKPAIFFSEAHHSSDLDKHLRDKFSQFFRWSDAANVSVIKDVITSAVDIMKVIISDSFNATNSAKFVTHYLFSPVSVKKIGDKYQGEITSLSARLNSLNQIVSYYDQIQPSERIFLYRELIALIEDLVHYFKYGKGDYLERIHNELSESSQDLPNLSSTSNIRWKSQGPLECQTYTLINGILAMTADYQRADRLIARVPDIRKQAGKNPSDKLMINEVGRVFVNQGEITKVPTPKSLSQYLHELVKPNTFVGFSNGEKFHATAIVPYLDSQKRLIFLEINSLRGSSHELSFEDFVDRILKADFNTHHNLYRVAGS